MEKKERYEKEGGKVIFFLFLSLCVSFTYMNSATKCNKLYLIYELYKLNIFLPDLFSYFSRFPLHKKVLLNNIKPKLP